MESNGISTFHGAARFVDRNIVEVDGELLEGQHFLIATGAKPRPLFAPGVEYVIDNAEFMELEELPKRILFVGGGYISFEFAHIAARAGSEVTILDRGNRPLKAFDPDLVDRLIERSRAAGIEIQLELELKSIKKAAATRSTARRPRCRARSARL